MHPISRNSNILSFFSNIEITNEVVVFSDTRLDDKYLVYFFCHHADPECIIGFLLGFCTLLKLVVSDTLVTQFFRKKHFTNNLFTCLEYNLIYSLPFLCLDIVALCYKL